MISKINKIFLFIYEYLSDLIMVIKYNSYSPFEEKQKKLFYRIIITAHTIEKGLALNSPRSLFGQAKFKDLMNIIREYDPVYGLFPLEMTAGAFEDYLSLHKNRNIEDEFLITVKRWLDEINAMANIEATGGVKMVSNYDKEQKSHTSFLCSRFSCRSYKDEIVQLKLIEDIISAAQSAPSQCNRQSSRVHCYQDKETIKSLLTLQAGSAGFSESVSNLFVITSELTAWGGAGQRNQAYVDGSLFSMFLMLSCQSYGVATCPLNLAVINKIESTIRKVGGIHDRERLIMMVAFGYPYDNELKAACSPRLSVSDVLTVH